MGIKQERPRDTGWEDDFSRADDAISQHRDLLKSRFPLDTAPVKPRRRIHPVATILAVAIGAVVWADPSYRNDQLATAVGQQLKVDLPDGSHIALNTDTRLDISWHIRSRQVTLRQGQALFDVAHQAYRPFTVDAGDALVTVLGTMFDVWRKPDSVKVTVLRGLVRVDQHGATALLAENQQATAGAALSGAISVDATAQTGWRDGKLVFERVALREALAEMQRYTNNRIVLVDGKLGGTPLSGVFDIARADGMLDLLPAILPVTVIRDGKGAVQVRAR